MDEEVNKAKDSMSDTGGGQSTLQRLPSDFTDVQSTTYDPQYISDINSRMQVPDRIAVQPQVGPLGDHDIHSVKEMTVPERILVGGQESHIGMRSTMLQQFNFDLQPQPDMSYVNLMTPPRVLTMEEQFFPTIDNVQESNKSQQGNRSHFMNGPSVLPFTPDPDSSLLLNNEDEVTVLRTQIAKLARRLSVVEQESDNNRSRIEYVVYPALIGYVVLKLLSWMFTSR